MSRPSTTMPPHAGQPARAAADQLRCAHAEVRSPTALTARRDVGGRGSPRRRPRRRARTCGVVGVGAELRAAARGPGRRPRSASAEVDAARERPPGERAVHRAGVEEAQAEPRGHAPGHAGLSRARRSVDRDDERAGTARGQRKPQTRAGGGPIKATRPPASAAASAASASDLSPRHAERVAHEGRSSARSGAATPLEERWAARARPRRDGQLDQAHRLTGRVLDGHVLDVDARLPRGREQPGELTRLVGQHHGHQGIGRRPATVLARQSRAPAVAAQQHLTQGGPAPVGVVSHLGQGRDHMVDVGRAAQ